MFESSCVYLTVYRGNKLPPFYVGSTLKSKIDKGYAGSVSSKAYKKIWALERKTNSNLFKTIVIKEYATRKEAYMAEDRLCKLLKVTTSPMYINKGPVIDAFRARGEKHPMFGSKHTADARAKMSKAHKGKIISKEQRLAIGHKFAGVPKTEEHRLKISEAKLGYRHTNSARQKMSESHIGKIMSSEARAKMSAARKGKFWWSNGFMSVKSEYCPGDGWYRGRK